MVKIEGIELKKIEYVYFNTTRLKVMYGTFEEKEHGYVFQGEGGPVFIPEGNLNAVMTESEPPSPPA